MSSPTTVPVPIVALDMSGWFVQPHEDVRVIDRHTLGQIRDAADALGDTTLFARVVQGCELAIETVSRFLMGEFQDVAQGTESTQRHSPFTI
jgi:hypothetical protein